MAGEHWNETLEACYLSLTKVASYSRDQALRLLLGEPSTVPKITYYLIQDLGAPMPPIV